MCDEKTKEKVAYKIIGLVASTPDTQISIESEKKSIMWFSRDNVYIRATKLTYEILIQLFTQQLYH